MDVIWNNRNFIDVNCSELYVYKPDLFDTVKIISVAKVIREYCYPLDRIYLFFSSCCSL